jgi:hypothetical protein
MGKGEDMPPNIIEMIRVIGLELRKEIGPVRELDRQIDRVSRELGNVESPYRRMRNAIEEIAKLRVRTSTLKQQCRTLASVVDRFEQGETDILTDEERALVRRFTRSH